MTTYFVSNAGSNTAPYDTEAKAATTLGVIAAIPWVAGDIVKGSSTHTEFAGAAITYTFPTTPGLQLLSVAFNGAGTGAITAGATVNVGAFSGAMTFNNGCVYAIGWTFAAGTNNSSAATFNLLNTTASPIGARFDSCTFSRPTVSTGAPFIIGPAGNSSNDDLVIELNNCTISQGSNRTISVKSGNININNLTLAGTAPTTVFTITNGCAPRLLLTASDLSAVAWTNLFDVSGATCGSVLVTGCKLRSGFTLTTGAFAGPGNLEVVVVDCASSDINYNYTKTGWSGTVTADITKYADASNGTDTLSWLMASGANASFTWPLVAPDITWWNSSLTTQTTTVPVAHNAVGSGTAGALTNADMWQETLSKITSGVPLGTWNVGSRVANILATAADQPTDSTTTWTGSSIATHQSLTSTNMAIAEVGPVVVVPKLAKASVSVYVSPKLLAGSSKQWMTAEGVFINEQPGNPFGGGTQ